MNKKLSLYGLLFIMVAFASCIKKEVTDLKDEGNTLIKILGGDNPFAISANFIDFVNTPQQLLGIDLRRDANSQQSLQTPMTVVIKDDTAAVHAADPSYVIMPSSWYTIQSEVSKVGGSGGTFTFEFKPGDFAKQIYITVPNATLLDPSTIYALGFSISTVSGGNATIANARSVVVTIGAKNAYDGVYECVWTNYHPSSNPGYTGGTTEIEFVTTGANKVKMFWNSPFSPFGPVYACPAILGGNLSAFGAQEPEFTIDVSTNAVTVQNSFVGATTFYNMVPTYRNDYDPSTKTFYVKWGYNNPGGVFDPTVTREWTQTIKYLRAR